MVASKKTIKPESKLPKTRKKVTKIDWNEALQYYLADGSVSYADIARKFGVSKNTVEKRGTKEKWVKLRQESSEKTFNTFQQKLLDQKTQSQSRHLQAFQNAQAVANKIIYELSESNYWKDKKGNLILNNDGKPIPIAVDPLDLQRAVTALKDSIMGERVVLGLPTNVSSLTDKDGNDSVGGFADMVMAAKKVNSGESRK